MTLESLTDLLGNFFDTPKVTGFQLITQGKENTTALVQMPAKHVILRLWGKTHGHMGIHSENDIKDEVAFMEFCRNQGIPVPKLFHSKAGRLYEKSPDGQMYAIMEYVGGDTPKQFTKDMTVQVAKTMAKIHLLVADFSFPEPRSWPGTVLEMTNERIKKAESEQTISIDPAIQKAITHYRTLLKNCNLETLPKGIIHGDIMWENIKFKDGKLEGIFDFGDCRESYFVEDITKTLLFAFESPEHSVFGENGENISIFLQAYQSVRKLTTEEKQSLSLFFLSRILYQLFGYSTKAAKGDATYEARVEGVIARYNQHLSFFIRESFS